MRLPVPDHQVKRIVDAATGTTGNRAENGIVISEIVQVNPGTGGEVTTTQKVAERLGGMQRCPTMYGGPVVCAVGSATCNENPNLTKTLPGHAGVCCCHFVLLLYCRRRGTQTNLAHRLTQVWYGMVWYGMVDVCDGYLAAEASGSSFG